MSGVGRTDFEPVSVDRPTPGDPPTISQAIMLQHPLTVRPPHLPQGYA